MQATRRFFHLSIDDVLPALVVASDTRRPLAESRMFGTLDRLYAAFGMNIDLYFFGTCEVGGKLRALEEVSEKVAADIRTRSWIRLGPHAERPDIAPHRQTTEDLHATLRRLFDGIDRLGGRDARSAWVRLHEFSEAYEAASFLTAEGVEALLTTDKPAVSWRLPRPETDILHRTGRVRFAGMDFVRSHLRVEELVARGVDRTALAARVREIVDGHGFVTIFTHEICFEDPRTVEMLHDLLETCRALGLSAR
jgi:hypothetical protein